MPIKFAKEELEFALGKSSTFTELISHLGYKSMSTNTKNKIKTELEFYKLGYKHLPSRKPVYKYPRIEKSCPVCLVQFEVSIGSPKEKTVCSHGCANTYFRSGSNNPNYKGAAQGKYRVLAFRHLAHACNICGWAKHPQALQVHHRDSDRNNNKLTNLRMLCPTCHVVLHLGL